MGYKFGLYNEKFKMASSEILEAKVEDVKGNSLLFQIIAGPLKWGEETMEDTYVLEVHYILSESKHTKELPLNGFGSMLCYDYADKAEELADKFCKEHNFILCNHLNSWPEYQAVVQKLHGEVVHY